MNTLITKAVDLFDHPDYARDLVLHHGSPLLVLDCEQIRSQYRRLAAALPGVDLHYAIKALPHPAVISTLDDEGAFFDLASSGEIALLRELRVNPRRTIHTHPIKRDRDIRDALRFGCTTFVVNNPDEIRKFERYRHRVGLLLRVSFRSSDAVVDLSKKFGCPVDEALFLLGQAAKLGLHVKGLSFHVGSQCGSPTAHLQAIESCAAIMGEAHRTGLANLNVLDIGGGFPVAYDDSTPAIEAFGAPLREALAKLPSYVRVIAEPGRFIAAPAMTCIASVLGKARRQGRTWYFLDDGVYGSFSGQIYDHARYPLATIPATGERFPSVLTGPTCDSIDLIAEDILLPALGLGDLVIGRMMGAYTAASATEFNSLPRTRILVINEPATKPSRVAYIA